MASSISLGSILIIGNPLLISYVLFFSNKIHKKDTIYTSCRAQVDRRNSSKASPMGINFRWLYPAKCRPSITSAHPPNRRTATSNLLNTHWWSHYNKRHNSFFIRAAYNPVSKALTWDGWVAGSNLVNGNFIMVFIPVPRRLTKGFGIHYEIVHIKYHIC